MPDANQEDGETPDGTQDALSRRRSLFSLGKAALIASTAFLAFGEAGIASKKTKKLKKKKCKKQVAQCSNALEQACEDNPECESTIPCCGLFSNCNAKAALLCILTNAA